MDSGKTSKTDWQKDIEHLTMDVTTELERTDAAIGLLLCNSPRNSQADTEEDELLENELLMPIGGAKQPDLVLDMELEKENQLTDKTTMSQTVPDEPHIPQLNNKEDKPDSDAMIISENITPLAADDRQNTTKTTTDSQLPTPKPKQNTKNGTLVIRSYKLWQENVNKNSRNI